jgi:hypothetical protein
MNKIIIMIMTIVAGGIQAQDFTVQKNGGTLEINLGRVIVEGHDGNEIIFTSRDQKAHDNERAKGMRLIGNMGVEDNTGLGIHVYNAGDVVKVLPLKKTGSPDILVRVPKNVVVVFRYDNQYGGKVQFRNLSNKLDVVAQYNSIELENVSGPVTVKTTYGSVDARFGSRTETPLSITSTYGHVDVSLPSTIKANVVLATSFGEILVAPDFKIDVEQRARYGGSYAVNGTLNGGGATIRLLADYGKVYLRKKA